jgi:Trk-type K+ transport system membrane component
MYISAYPIAITIRSTNTYEERSLGIFSDDPEYESVKGKQNAANPLYWLRNKISPTQQEGSRWYFVQQQLRAQLAHDLWWLALAAFLIMIIEGGNFESSPATYSVFNVLFEIVSGTPF